MLKVRKVEPDDRKLLDYWTDGNTLVYSDDRGPVAALRTTSAVRVDIQFFSDSRIRNARAVFEGFGTYIEVLAKRGIEEVIFNSDSKEMARFCMKRFRFRYRGGNTYSLRLR